MEMGAVQRHSDYEHIQSRNQSNNVSLINGICKNHHDLENIELENMIFKGHAHPQGH